MKRKTLVLAAFLAALLSSVPTSAISESQSAALKKAVADVPVLELAPKAAKLVQKASDKDQEEVAVIVVRTIVSKRPAVAPSVVEAIAKVAPATTPAIAAAATELAPEQALRIAKIAATFAPAEAAKVAAGVAKAAPGSAVSVARSVIAIVPMESPAIMEEVMAAVPASRAALENDTTLNLVTLLARNSRSSASASVRKGIVGSRPRLNPPAAPPTVTPPGSTVAEVRNQAQIDFQKIVIPQIEATLNISKTDASEIINASIGTINLIARDTTISKQEKNALMDLTQDTLVAIVTEGSLQGKSKTDLAKASVSAINIIVSDPRLDAAEKSAIADFASKQITAIAQNTALVGTDVINTVNTVTQQVQDLGQKAATTELKLSDIQAAKDKVEESVIKYSAP